MSEKTKLAAALTWIANNKKKTSALILMVATPLGLAINPAAVTVALNFIDVFF